MSEYINEIDYKLNKKLDTISISKIREQRKQCICKMTNINEEYGTGFFCKIHFDDFDKNVLITHNSFQTPFQKIDLKCSFKKDVIKINLENRIIYKIQEHEITFIEIKNEDNIDDKQFFELDENIFYPKPNEIYKEKIIYLLYISDLSTDQCFGAIKEIDTQKNVIQHLCSSREGSLGAPIINFSNKKVIGMHKGCDEQKKWNLATFLKIPIIKFLEYCVNYEEDNNILKTCSTSPDSFIISTKSTSSIFNNEIAKDLKKKYKKNVSNGHKIIINFIFNMKIYPQISVNIDMKFKDVIDNFLNKNNLKIGKDVVCLCDSKYINKKETKTLKELGIQGNDFIYII